MNERPHFFIKIYLSHFILERVDVSLVCERWVDRHILRERSSSSHIFFQEPAGGNACTPLQARQRRPDRLLVPHSTAILCTLSKSDRVVLIMWSPPGYTPVRPECPDTPSSSCLLIKMWQLTKAHRITRNETKVHVMCYITPTLQWVSCILDLKIWWWSSSNPGALGNAEYPFIAITPKSILARVVATDRVLSVDQKQLFHVWTECKQMTYAKLNCLKLNCLVISLSISKL